MSFFALLFLRRLLPFGALPALGFLAWQMPDDLDGLPAVAGWLWARAGGDTPTAIALAVLALALISLFGGRLIPRI